MKIYMLKVDFGKRDNNCQYQLVNRDLDYLNKFKEYLDKAERVRECLSDLRVWAIKGKKECDCSRLWDGSLLCLISEKALKLLEPFVKNDVEFIKMDNGLYLINVLCVADALNLKEIEVSTGYIEKFSFVPDKLPNSEIFKVLYHNEVYEIATFVTEKFKEVVEVNQLTGFKFEEIGDF